MSNCMRSEHLQLSYLKLSSLLSVYAQTTQLRIDRSKKSLLMRENISRWSIRFTLIERVSERDERNHHYTAFRFGNCLLIGFEVGLFFNVWFAHKIRLLVLFHSNSRNNLRYIQMSSEFWSSFKIVDHGFLFGSRRPNTNLHLLPSHKIL